MEDFDAHAGRSEREDVVSDLEVEDLPPSSKRKYQGSATYSTKFDSRWREHYPCIQAVKGDQYSFLCSTCCKKVSCKHMGVSDATLMGQATRSW